jgi:predicted enzyme related to lactoylglutathione lyase
MGNPFVHLDLATGDVEAAKKFYKSVFDWKFNDFPEMGWTGIDVGQGVGGGIGPKQMPEQPSAWTAYVEVDDVKKSIAKAKKAGANVVVEYMPIGEMGALGVFVDPQGASIGVWQSFAKKEEPKPAAAPAKKPAGKLRFDRWRHSTHSAIDRAGSLVRACGRSPARSTRSSSRVAMRFVCGRSMGHRSGRSPARSRRANPESVPGSRAAGRQ